MKSAHMLPVTIAIVALGFLVAAAILARVIDGATVNAVWPQATENAGQAAVACVLGGVVIGGLIGLVGQFVADSRARHRD